jgi:hypothetical protein
LEDKNITLNFASKIEFQEIKSNLLKYYVNPIFVFYWKIVKSII